MIQFRIILVLLFLAFIFDSGAQTTKENSIRPESIQTKINIDSPTPSDFKGDLCVPEYSSGCDAGDGFTDFAVEEIENYNSGCADNMGFDGWSQYLELGPAFLLPGETYDFIMQTGYSNQYVTIWIDFNDDYILTSDEKILIDFVMEDDDVFYTAQATIPSNALAGQHYMRARTNWQNSCNDPCEGYGYGEAEDYLVIIGIPSYGEIGGLVSELATGNPIEGATIALEGLFNYTITTGSNGIYFKDDLMVGEYELECYKEGYNLENLTITIEEGVLLTQNFQLTQPVVAVYPLAIDVELDQNETTEETLTIENSGNGPMAWSASTQILNEDKKDFLDLQFEFPSAGGYGEAGIESDGQYIYTTKWNSNEFLQYELDGTYIGAFSISGVSTVRDLAYDGTCFYGGNGFTTVYEMDFETHTLVSVITTLTNVRALAYNESEDVFYGNNWSSPVFKFDKAGNTVGGFEVGPYGSNYYGFAYDQSSVGGPYLWGYAQVGDSQNEIIQMQLPSGNETGLALDVTELLSGQVWGAAGGLFTQPNLVFGKWTLGGMVQNERVWGLELSDAQTWLGVYPNGGTLEGGESEELTVLFDATDLEGGNYGAEIHFTTFPDVGSPVVDVTMFVYAGFYYPCNVQSEVNCTDVNLTWENCPSGAPDPDSYNVYRDNEIVANVDEMFYTDSLLYPDSLYEYRITGLFGVEESTPSPLEEVIVPLPENLEPANLTYSINGYLITLYFDAPAGCLAPEGYNVYRDGTFIEFITEPSYQSPAGTYEYFVTAVYYFGESQPSNTILVIYTSNQKEDISSQLSIYPNPVKDKLCIQSTNTIFQIELLNNLGLAILTNKVNSNTYQLNVSSVNPGIYFLKIEMDQGFTLQKVLIQ